MASKRNEKPEQSPQPDKPARKTRKAPDPAAIGPAEPTNRKEGLTVVGIGASAGGLTALQSFFETLSRDTGMAFVVVTNLYPEHESHLVELLQKYSSTTEAFETRKEKLQTVNSKMRAKLDEMTRAHQELESLMGSTDVPTLYLDRELRIQRYTAGVKELFNMMQIDRGRRINDLTHKLGYNKFAEDAEQVMQRLIPMEREVQLEKGESLLIRLRPYRTADDQIEGLVITFIDITELKEAQRELILMKESLEQRVQERTRELDEANASLRQARDMFYALFHGNPIPAALVRIEDGIFLDINSAYLEYFGLAREDLIGHTWQEFDLPVGPAMQSKLIKQLGQEGMLRDLELEINHPSGGTRTILASVQQVQLDGSSCVIATFIDITERVHAEQRIRALASRLTAGEQKERHRLARILHDELQQKIFAVKMQLIFLAEALEKNDLKNLKVDLHQLDTWLAEAIATTRQLSIDLSPPILQGEGLVEAIIWLAAQMKEQYSLEVAVQTNGVNPVFEEDVRVLIFQSVRELLFNVVKHSGTLEADVTFEQMDGKALIAVSDRGRGFDSEKTMQDPEKAYGLSRMRQRLFLLGCDLEVKSRPNKGTEIAIVAPVKETMD